MSHLKAVVRAIVPKGKHGPFAIATSEKLDGSVTFSLEPTVWKEVEWPEEGMQVFLAKLRQKRAGWRAKLGRFWKPSDEQGAGQMFYIKRDRLYDFSKVVEGNPSEFDRFGDWYLACNDDSEPLTFTSREEADAHAKRLDAHNQVIVLSNRAAGSWRWKTGRRSDQNFCFESVSKRFPFDPDSEESKQAAIEAAEKYIAETSYNAVFAVFSNLGRKMVVEAPTDNYKGSGYRPYSYVCEFRFDPKNPASKAEAKAAAYERAGLEYVPEEFRTPGTPWAKVGQECPDSLTGGGAE